MKRGILAILILLGVQTQGQNNKKLDSLLIEARKEINDSAKIDAFNRIAFSYIFSNADKAIEVIKEGETLATEVSDYYGLAQLTNTKGIYMDVTGESDSARIYFTKALDLSKQHKFQNLEIRCTNNLGMFNWNRGNFQNALNYFFDALKMNDSIGTEKESAIYLNNIGLIYQEMYLANKALEYHRKAYEVRLKYDFKKDQAASLNNIGICLKELERFQEAEDTYKKGLAVAEESDNLRDYYRILDNLGNIYLLQNKHEEAVATYMKALDIPEELRSSEKENIATYSNLVKIYNIMGKPQEGKQYLEKGLDILEKNPHFMSDNEEFYLNAAENNFMLGNFKKARTFTETFVAIKDSVFSEKNAKAVADLEIKYETEKKEKQILVQRSELAEKSLTIQKRNYQVYGALILALVLGLIGYLFYNQQKLKNRQLQKENELKDALAEIETQNSLQDQRLRISRDLHDNIGAQLTFIISSIDNLKYGFKIKDDKLTNKLERISGFTVGTIYELRDTIWAMNKSEITFDDLQSRISNFIDKADVVSRKTNFNFKVDDDLTETITFSSIEGMNIYRIIQEGVNNAIKYSEATEINVKVGRADSQLHIEITDNGKGFDQSEAQFGNGLFNMKKRASELKAEINITSVPGQGTTISLKKPLNT